MSRWAIHQQLRKLPRIIRATVDVLRAQLAVVRALLILRFRKRGSLLNRQTSQATVPDTAPRVGRAQQLAVAVRRAVEHGPFRASCLARALATYQLLEREGLHGSAIRIGVQVKEAKLVAHAWVEFGGVKLIESESEVSDLAEVNDVRVRMGA